jgi:hypothetical protein
MLAWYLGEIYDRAAESRPSSANMLDGLFMLLSLSALMAIAYASTLPAQVLIFC